jgi:hypothetical protein
MLDKSLLILILVAICIISACSRTEQTKKRDYLSTCEMNWSKNVDFINVKNNKIKELGHVDEYFILQEGGHNELSYAFTLVGIRAGEGFVLYFSNNVIKPIYKELNLNLAQKLLKQAEMLDYTAENIEGNIDVNHVSCYVLTKSDKKNSKEFVGFILDHEIMSNLVDELFYLTKDIE